MNDYVESPHEWTGYGDSIFLAGGITGCPDWQGELYGMLWGIDPLVVINPRRRDFPIDDPEAADFQIKWEFRHLRRVDRIAFWFPKENRAGCPITLYELGAWSMTDKPLVVGVEPGYEREADVRIQTELVRPEIAIVHTLEDLAKGIIGQ